MQVKLVESSQLAPHPQNPKIHTEKQLQHIANSISRFGWTQPIVVDENRQILIGHGRWAAAKQDHQKVPVVQISNLTEAQKLSLMLLDNQTNQETGFDPITVEQIAAQLTAAEFPAHELGLIAEVLGETTERAKDENKLKEAYDKYLNGEVMRMVLYFQADEGSRIEEQIEQIMREEEIPAKADLVMQMILEYERENGAIQ